MAVKVAAREAGLACACMRFIQRSLRMRCRTSVSLHTRTCKNASNEEIVVNTIDSEWPRSSSDLVCFTMLGSEFHCYEVEEFRHITCAVSHDETDTQCTS